jgi:hypothetical protein
VATNSSLRFVVVAVSKLGINLNKDDALVNLQMINYSIAKITKSRSSVLMYTHKLRRCDEKSNFH